MYRFRQRRQFPGRSVLQVIRCRTAFVLLAFLASGAHAQFDLEDVLSAVVTCEYLEAGGLSLRATSGVLLRDGLLLPYSALAGVATVDAHTRDGRTWSSSDLIALHPEADLALLQIDGDPPYALPAPLDVTLPSDEEITLVRGPDGPGPSTKKAALYGRFDLDGPDYLAISEGLENGAAAFRADGELLGVCFDLSEQGHSLVYLASAASIRNLLEHRGSAVSLNSIVAPTPPEYKVRTTVSGLTFRAAILQTAHKPDDARKFLDLALKKDPALASAHFWMGRVYFAEQRFEQAAASFQRAGELADHYQSAWHMAGASYNQASNYPLALEMYRKALVVDPRSAPTWCNLGGTEFNRRNFTEAEFAFEKAIEFDPSYGLAYFNLGILQRRTGRNQDAEHTYEALLRQDPSWAPRLRTALDTK
jgi:Tfp pilus assembly protein PilF